ncbi:MAG: glycosyltransferase [Paracoccaceae bacterium]
MSDGQVDSVHHRVVIFLHAFAAGGAEAVLLGVANDLYLNGIDVVVVAARAEGPNRRKLNEKIEVIDLGARRMALSVPALMKVLKEIDPTVCLSALTHANIALIAACRLARSRAKVVVSERLSLHFEFIAAPPLKRVVKQFLIKRLYPKADAIIAVSKALKVEIEEMVPATSTKVIALPNPVDIALLWDMAEDPSAFSVENDQVPVIAFVGRLSRQKNLPLLLKAFKQLRDLRPARLVLAGDGPLKSELEALVEELSLGQDVEFAGYLSNPYRLIKEANIMALSSDFEGLPNVLIEALALETEIVSTDCPTGPAEILNNGAYGHLVPCNDLQAFSAAMNNALNEPLLFDRREALSSYQKGNALSAYRKVLFS